VVRGKAEALALAPVSRLAEGRGEGEEKGEGEEEAQWVS
jgi:hypothetical protein